MNLCSVLCEEDSVQNFHLQNLQHFELNRIFWCFCLVSFFCYFPEELLGMMFLGSPGPQAPWGKTLSSSTQSMLFYPSGCFFRGSLGYMSGSLEGRPQIKHCYTQPWKRSRPVVVQRKPMVQILWTRLELSNGPPQDKMVVDICDDFAASMTKKI